MIYKIQDTIHFRSDDGLLWLDDESGVTLTATTSRLLKYLLDHKERVVYRDEILQNVWDAHGLRTSSHSLNKYISDLRAVFRNMGCDEDVIVTVPRVGFMVSERIVIERITPPAHEVNAQKEHGSDSVNHHENRPDQEKSSVSVAVIKAASYMCFALLLFTLLFVGFKTDFYHPRLSTGQAQVYSLGDTGKCRIQSFSIVPMEYRKQVIAMAKDLIVKEGMRCSDNSVFYFNVAETVLNGNPGRVFLAHCIYLDEKKGDFYSCENYYRADYAIVQ